MRILYMKGILNEANPVSRRQDFQKIDILFRPELNLLWDENVPDIIYHGNDHALSALSTLESLKVEDDLMSQLKGACSTCHFFYDENIDRRKRQLVEKSSDGLFQYHNRVVIPRPTLALIKMAHFVPCHKEIPKEESRHLFMSNCCKLHGVPN
jgi:hypothetical protein